MKERDYSPSCERASDLIAFIYNEADEREAQDFQLHFASAAVVVKKLRHSAWCVNRSPRGATKR